MGSFIINGGKPLSGTVFVSGSKNAALPILFSCLSLRGISTLSNIPDIGDVDVALKILESFGARVKKCSEYLEIDTRNLKYSLPDTADVSKIRASSYLIGATLSRFGVTYLQRFGGCNFDDRPIDMHIYAAECLGAKLEGDKLSAEKLVGADIYFKKISVGATVNALIMASNAEGESRIYGYAKEPHITSLAEFLRRAGAKITFSDECISVTGAKLSDSSAEIIPDMIEAGTFLALSLMVGSSIEVSGADVSHLEKFLHSLASLGTVAEFDSSKISVLNVPLGYAEIKTSPYPGFPTDLAPQMAPLLASGEGGIITEGVFHGRFGYLDSLSRFGVKSKRGDGFAVIEKSDIKPSCACATDLRGGAALLMCALFAKGESRIDGSEIIKRGYTDIVNKLSSLGADIKEEINASF